MKGTVNESMITMNHLILLREVVPEIVEEPVQQVTVNGRVTDADSGESLMGVTVFVMGTQTGTTTDADGRFTLADRKSTRLNSSHVAISYAVFCLKKKNEQDAHIIKETNDY